MKILILGAGGFIGSHLVEHLVSTTDHELIGVDVTNEKLATVSSPRFTYLESDVAAATDDLVASSDVVVDLVAYANPSIYVETPLDVFELNFETNLKVVRSCVQHQKRLIQYSTSEIYGKASPASGTFREDESDLVFGPVTKQRWIYAAAKQLLERVIHAYGLRGELEYSVLRPFNFLGPRMDHLVSAGAKGGPRVFAHYMSALLTGGPMYLVDGGHVNRTFLDIRDANRAFTSILDRQSVPHAIYNVGNPRNNSSIRDFARLMCEVYEEITATPPNVELVEISGEDFYGEGYEDMDRVPPDVSRLKALGWEPKYDLRDILRHSVSYYLEAGAAMIPA